MEVKQILFFTLTSFFICTVFNTIQIYNFVSRYRFIFVWSQDNELMRSYEFYIIPFIANFLICLILLIFILKKLNINKIINKKLFFIPFLFITSLWAIFVIVNPLVFGLDVFLFAPEIENYLPPNTSKMFCEYFRFFPPEVKGEGYEYEVCGRKL